MPPLMVRPVIYPTDKLSYGAPFKTGKEVGMKEPYD